jgi:SAM-dependent methyltransferase
VKGGYRLYDDLAGWWPLISPVQEYSGEARALAAVLATAAVPVREVLDLGSGGGHLAWHLKGAMRLTLADRSEPMLAVSRQLNPECEHLRADMLTVRLGRLFDAVLVHDAIDYVTTQAGLRQVTTTAFAHCRPGGIAVFVPGHTAQTFRPGTGRGGSSAAGRQASFRERTWDPDPADDWVQAEYEFTLRDADGSVQVVREAHRLGAFSEQAWLRALTAAGFTAQAGPGAAAGAGGPGGLPGMPRNVFAGHRPAGPDAACAMLPG